MSSCVIDLMDWANKAGEKEENDKDGDADPDEVEVGQADVGVAKCHKSYEYVWWKNAGK